MTVRADWSFPTCTAPVRWNTKKSRIEFTATAFSALVHFDASNTGALVYIKNDTNTAGFKANQINTIGKCIAQTRPKAGEILQKMSKSSTIKEIQKAEQMAR